MDGPVIRKKACPKCGLLRNDVDFLPRRAVCKKCYSRTSVSRSRTLEGKEVRRFIRRRYNHSSCGRAVNLNRSKRLLGSDAYKARYSLCNAVRQGRILRPNKCSVSFLGDCAERVEGHHWKGYEKVFWLDVLWLCKHHHAIFERLSVLKETYFKMDRMKCVCGDFI